MSKKAKNKVCVGAIFVIMTLLSSICLGSLNWSYIDECTHDFYEVQISLFKKGLHCYGTTDVDIPNYAGVTVYLKELDSDGDWVTVTAWEDKDYICAAVDVEYAVSSGTYKLELMHKAYLANDLSTPVEIFWDDTPTITIGN